LPRAGRTVCPPPRSGISSTRLPIAGSVKPPSPGHRWGRAAHPWTCTRGRWTDLPSGWCLPSRAARRPRSA
jgi:hypothetical protein